MSYVWCDRTGVEDLGRRAPRNLAVSVDQEFIQLALNRVLGVYRAGITHVIVLEWNLHNRDPRALALLVTRNDTRISLELRIFRAKRENLELAIGQERHAQIIQRHDLLDLVGILLGKLHRDVAAH